MKKDLLDFYNDIERLKRLNRALSDTNFYLQRGYIKDEIPQNILELSFPVKNPLPLVNNDAKTILDIGCGGGMDIFLIQKQFPEKKVFGLDISFNLISTAKSFCKNLVCGNAIFLPFKNLSFDVVILNGVFNLFENKIELLDEMKRVLNSNGSIIVADVFKEKYFVVSDIANFLNLGMAETLENLFKIFSHTGFEYEFGDYEKEIIPNYGIFITKWRRNE